jgi:20S proteasome alpha/beta subunit
MLSSGHCHCQTITPRTATLACSRSTNELSSFQEKVFKIDDHMGIAIAGLTSDARTLATHMRSECLNYKYLYGSPMVTGRLVAALADKHQKKTMASWRRPYGVGMLVIGADVSIYFVMMTPEDALPLACNRFFRFHSSNSIQCHIYIYNDD